MSPDPRNYYDAVSGVGAVGWCASMAEERKPLIEHDVFGWVNPLQDIQVISSSFLYRWTYNKDGMPCRQKPRVVVQGFHEADTETDNTSSISGVCPPPDSKRHQ